MLGDLAALDAEDIAGRKPYSSAGRRHAEIKAVVRAGVDEARRHMGIVCDHDFGRDFQIGQAGQAPLEEGDGALLGRHAGRRRRRGAHLMVHVIVREEGGESVDVMIAQRFREAFGNGFRRSGCLCEDRCGDAAGEKDAGCCELSSVLHGKVTTELHRPSLAHAHTGSDEFPGGARRGVP
jgi:hypothetical protein